jgi:hypothetical protein
MLCGQRKFDVLGRRNNDALCTRKLGPESRNTKMRFERRERTDRRASNRSW